ncbi:unnamed protein product [Rodentolepis nana]|uniref:Uncharacterized protein n=1 Tax=Rodentolepis nana TaxID=102285 RepID=A0A0R3TEL0_RODNA|nr:unnamed protein product [Rodentolepis nana]
MFFLSSFSFSTLFADIISQACCSEVKFSEGTFTSKLNLTKLSDA